MEADKDHLSFAMLKFAESLGSELLKAIWPLNYQEQGQSSKPRLNVRLRNFKFVTLSFLYSIKLIRSSKKI